MSVILVVEPDSSRAAQLAAMARKHLTSELVMADSVDRALATVRDRVPDVVLLSPLLSRQDEAALAGWLRDLGPGAAHVQELTIPMLATAPPDAPKRRSALFGLRRERHDMPTTDGCEPDEFAHQVAAYVRLAYAHRGIAEPVVERLPAPQVEPAARLTEPEIVAIDTNTIDTSTIDTDTIETVTLRTEAIKTAAVDTVAVDTAAVDTVAVETVAVETVALETAAAETLIAAEDNWIAIALDEACEAPAPTRPVWMSTPIAAPPSRAQSPARNAKGRRSRRKAAQDDWDVFDPDQCDFAVLVATLNQITDANHADQASTETHGRVVAY